MYYFILVDGRQEGPFSIQQLAAKGINADTMVWCEGMEEWQPADHVAELQSLLLPEEPEPIPEPAPQPETVTPRKSRRGLLKTLIIVAAVAVALVLTNPSKKKHMDTLQKLVTEYIADVKTDAIDDATKAGLQLGVGLIAKMGDQLFEYHNYGIFSTLTEKQTGKTLSTGFLTMVILKKHDEITDGLESLKQLRELSKGFGSSDTADDAFTTDEDDEGDDNSQAWEPEPDSDIDDEISF